MKRIGVLALQGAFLEHVYHLERAAAELPEDFEIVEVRTPGELQACDALVIPGGESTVMSLIAERTEMLSELRKFVQDPAHAVWGTCAGLIFLGSGLVNGKEGQHQLHGMDIEVMRNAFGRQLQSFTRELDFSSFIPGLPAFTTTFIRAPVVTKVGPGVKILYKLSDPELVVAVREGNKLGTSFHPELAEDSSFHKWFLTDFVSM